MPSNQNMLTLDELRKIVLGLKMSGLAYVEQNALDDIGLRIKGLPSPEALSEFGNNPRSIENLKNEVGYIMEMIDAYSSRGPEFKVRHKSLTGLPPRYNVLEWRGQMAQEAKAFTKELIKMSSVVDEKGHGRVAGNLIKCAKNLRDGEVYSKDLDVISKDLSKLGFHKESKRNCSFAMDARFVAGNKRYSKSDYEYIIGSSEI